MTTIKLISIMLLSGMLFSCTNELTNNEESEAIELRIKSNQTSHKFLEAINWGYDAKLKARYGHSSVVFNERIWIIGGMVDGYPTNDILYSDNGVHWVKVPLHPLKRANRFSPRTDHATTVFDGKIWVVGGKEYSQTDHDENNFLNHTNGLKEHDHDLCDSFSELNDVWSSVDGVNWNLESEDASFFPRYSHSLAAHNNELFLFGGYSRDYFNEISGSGGIKDAYKSYNGIDWETVTEFKNVQHFHDSRVNGGSVSFKNHLLYLGSNSWENEEDLFYSSNGLQWHKTQVGVEVASRSGHAILSDGSHLWLTAGALKKTPEYTSQNDIWYSINGETWVEAQLSQNFPARKDHTSVFFKNRLWIINGYNMENNSALQDIWSFGEPGCCEIDDLQLMNN